MKPNEAIGITLRHLREEAGLSAKEVSKLLDIKHANRMSPYTLFNYEKGRCSPDPTRFVTLCVLYGCKDILHVFGFTDEPLSNSCLKKEDREILKRFHNLPDSGKDIIRGALGIEKSELTKEKNAL